MIYKIDPPVISEISSTETLLVTTTYHFTVPAEMAQLRTTSSVPTGFTAVSLAPINTPRTPNIILTLPPGYRALNASIPTPVQTPSGSPGGPSSSGHSLSVLFQHSLNFLLEDLLRLPLAILILVALFRHSLQITSFWLVDIFTKVV